MGALDRGGGRRVLGSVEISRSKGQGTAAVAAAVTRGAAHAAGGEMSLEGHKGGMRRGRRGCLELDLAAEPV